MLIITSQIVLLLAAIIIPLKSKKSSIKARYTRYNIDTDTSNSSYAINEFGSLELINRINTAGPAPEMEN